MSVLLSAEQRPKRRRCSTLRQTGVRMACTAKPRQSRRDLC